MPRDISHVSKFSFSELSVPHAFIVVSSFPTSSYSTLSIYFFICFFVKELQETNVRVITSVRLYSCPREATRLPWTDLLRN